MLGGNREPDISRVKLAKMPARRDLEGCFSVALKNCGPPRGNFVLCRSHSSSPFVPHLTIFRHVVPFSFFSQFPLPLAFSLLCFPFLFFRFFGPVGSLAEHLLVSFFFHEVAPFAEGVLLQQGDRRGRNALVILSSMTRLSTLLAMPTEPRASEPIRYRQTSCGLATHLLCTLARGVGILKETGIDSVAVRFLLQSSFHFDEVRSMNQGHLRAREQTPPEQEQQL